MRAKSVPVFCSVFVVVALSLPIFAHHSTSAEFDSTRRIMLMGMVTKVAWVNPHSYFLIEAKDPRNGILSTWACELGSPNMLATLGWKQNTLKVGMSVSFTGILARDGSHKVIARNIVADGSKLTAWPSEQTSR